MAYFERLDDDRFLATEHVGGAWELSEQHIAPALGLLVHCVELDRDRRRDDGLQIVRISHDILGTVPVAEVSVEVRVTRPGRTIELVEAVLSHAGRAVVVLRAWLLQAHDTVGLAGSPLPSIPGPDAVPTWDAGAVWPGGFIKTAEVRRAQDEPGRARFWVRTDVPLVADEPVSDVARLCGLLDIANGMTVRVDPRDVAFPNVDLTAHFFRAPQGEWLGCDTSVSFGPTGLGLTTSVLHDVDGPFGTLNQALTVRPGPAASR
ncbi:MAG TPA: thioesterase family protein [Angustibacter sp.]|nr:thioesterase family protein [Angustibacter sp.]